MNLRCITFLLLFTGVLSAQNFPGYRLYSIDEFAKNHFDDPESFYKAFYDNGKYPALAREKDWEGVVDVIMIHHPDSALQVIVSNGLENYLRDNIKETLLRTQKLWLHTDIPFIVYFCIEYDLIGNQKQAATPSCKLTIVDFPTSEWKDTNYIHNGYGITYFPQIIESHGLRSDVQPFNRYPVTSVEEVLESAILTCCHKKFDLKYIQPNPPHGCHQAGVEYHYPKDIISVVINSYGNISDIGLLGKRIEKVNKEQLLRTLSGVHFRPALIDCTPVHLSMSYSVE